MFGSGDMFLSDYNVENMSQDTASLGGDPQLFPQNPMLDFEASPSPTPQFVSSQAPISNSVKSTRPEIIREEVKYVDKPQRRIMEIRVFYDDQTYDTFIPSKK
jgi:hypothetical protein